ncbi:MAG: FAD-binding oxidoreductase [Acidobacteriaceae bacterium]|nr:FAD-binding oxidoreductase [Acidobacteriaceae bacterium]
MLASESQADRSIADKLQAAISGDVVLPSDEYYADACRVWNSAVEHRPAMIAFCEQTSDVQAAVRAARRHGLPLSVRGGGHDWAGRAVCEDGLVIDLTRMRDVVVDLQRMVATVAGGAKVKNVAAAADAHGLLAALGNCGTVGMAGLTLGGGYGPFIGAHGLATDNLLGAEVVLADGRRVTADAHNEPELFWALRGGGGNFGAVTSLQIQLHEKRHMLAGSILYPWSEAKNVLSRYAAFAATAPDELGLFVGMASGPDGQLAVQLAPLWNGEEHRGERVMRDLQALGTPLFAQVRPMTYSDILAPVDAMLEQKDGCHWWTRTRWLPALTPGAIDVMIAAVASKTSPHSMLFIHPFHGAATRVAPHATAFGLRREHFLLEIIPAWEPNGDDGSTHRQWAQELWHSLAPFALPGDYANLLGPEDREQAAHAYGSNGARLRALKRRFDPDNVFASAIPLPEE